MMNTMPRRGQGKSINMRFVEWQPETFVSDAARGAAALKERLRSGVADFCRHELGVQAGGRGASRDQRVTCVKATIEGFADSVECAAPTTDLLALWAIGLGADPERHCGATGGEISSRLAEALTGSLLDVFCDAITAPGTAPTAGEPVPSADEMGSLASSSEVVRLAIAVDECGLALEFKMSAPDFASVCSSGAGNRMTARPAEMAQKFRKRLEQIEMAVEGAIVDRKTTFGEMRSWGVGSVIQLTSSPRSSVALNVGGRSLYRCQIERDGECLALRILGGNDGEP